MNPPTTPAVAGEKLRLNGISLDGRQGEPAGMMTVTAHMSDGSERVLIQDNGNVISHWTNMDAYRLVSAPAVAEEGEGDPGGGDEFMVGPRGGMESRTSPTPSPASPDREEIVGRALTELRVVCDGLSDQDDGYHIQGDDDLPLWVLRSLLAKLEEKS